MKEIIIGGDGGLNLTTGSLSKSPSSLLEADNVVIDAPGIIKSRKGFGANVAQQNDFYPPGAESNGRPGRAGMFYSPKFNNSMFLAQGVNRAQIADLKTDGNGAVGASSSSPYPSFTANTNHGFAMTKDNLYWLNEDTAGNTTPRQTELIRFQLNGTVAGNKTLPAGLPQPVFINRDTDTALVTNANSWLDDDQAVCYRIVFKYTDDAGTVHLSAPSERLILRKQAATQGDAPGVSQSPKLYFLLPPYGTTPYSDSPWIASSFPCVFQVYRSRLIDLTATVTDPDDELQLVYEADFISSTTTLSTVSVFTFTDNTPDEALGIFDAPFLYTDPENGENSAFNKGIINANTLPPGGKTMALWRDCLWLGNLLDPPVQKYQLLSTVGINPGDQIDIAPAGTPPATIPACAGVPAFFYEWKVVTSGTVSYNIEKTANNLCAAINLNGAHLSGVYATYVSGYGGAPGEIKLTGIPILLGDGNYFTVSNSGLIGQNFSPPVYQIVTAEISTNWVTFSKAGIYEAFPFVQRFQVGRAETTIQRIFPFRGSNFVFTDTGIFRITGHSAYDFSVVPFHDTFVLLNGNSVTVCDDAVYAWGRQGILKITENSAEYIHLPIEPLHLQILDNLSLNSSTSARELGWSFVVAHQFQHKVYFFYASTDAYEAGCDKALIYDTRMKAFTTLSFNDTAGGFFRVCAGAECTANGKLYLHDFAVGTGAGGALYIRSNKNEIDDTDYAETDAFGAEVPMEKTLTWVAVAPSPSEMKQFRELQVYFNVDPVFPDLDKPTEPCGLAFQSDTGQANATLPPNGTVNLSRQSIPNTLQRSTRMKVTLTHEAVEYIAIEGIAVTYEQEKDNERVTRATP